MMKSARIPRFAAVRLLNLLLVPILLLAAGAGMAAASASGPAPASAQDSGDDVANVEFTLPNVQAIDDLLALDADLGEYVRRNDDGTVTVHAIVTPEERAYYESLGYVAGATIEDSATWAAARAERAATIAAEEAARNAAQGGAQAAPMLGPQ